MKSNKIDIMDCDYDNDLFLDMSKGLEMEPERGARCIKCYYLRMNKTAIEAKNNNYDYFATTLTLSPLKDAKKLNEIGEKLQEKYNIKEIRGWYVFVLAFYYIYKLSAQVLIYFFKIIPQYY